LCNLWFKNSLLAVDDPGYAEAIGAHTEAFGPEGLREGHRRRAAFSQRVEDPLAFVAIVEREGDGKTFRLFVVSRRRVRAQQSFITKRERRVQHLVAPFGRCLLRSRRAVEVHNVFDLAAERLLVKLERLGTVTIEKQVRM